MTDSRGAVYPLIHLVLLIRNNCITQGKLLFFLHRGEQPPGFPHVLRLFQTLPQARARPGGGSRQHSHVAGINSACVCTDFYRLQLLPPRYFPNPTSGWHAQPAHSMWPPRGQPHKGQHRLPKHRAHIPPRNPGGWAANIKLCRIRAPSAAPQYKLGRHGSQPK